MATQAENKEIAESIIDQALGVANELARAVTEEPTPPAYFRTLELFNGLVSSAQVFATLATIPDDAVDPDSIFRSGS